MDARLDSFKGKNWTLKKTKVQATPAQVTPNLIGSWQRLVLPRRIQQGQSSALSGRVFLMRFMLIILMFAWIVDWPTSDMDGLLSWYLSLLHSSHVSLQVDPSLSPMVLHTRANPSCPLVVLHGSVDWNERLEARLATFQSWTIGIPKEKVTYAMILALSSLVDGWMWLDSWSMSGIIRLYNLPRMRDRTGWYPLVLWLGWDVTDDPL